MHKKIIIALWALLGIGTVSGVLCFLFIKWGWIGYMPDMEEIQSPISRYASQVFSEDGKLISTWSRNENRVFVEYDSISPYVINALVATEDERFYEHSGIDVRAIARAVIKRGILRQKEAGGGSTITQQLAKQLYSTTAESSMQRLLQKPIEWVIAVELERNFTKQEIINLYLNYFDFLHNAVGIKTAAKVYFNKTPKDLTITEAAMLVGMCKNPSYYNPVGHPERARERRNVVLHQMYRSDYITKEEYRTLCEEPLTLDYHVANRKNASGAYLSEYLKTIMMAEKPNRSNYRDWQYMQFQSDSALWETDPLYGWCNKNKKRDGSTYDIYTDGLRIYTTIDSRMQKYAEAAMYKHVAQDLQPEFNKGRKIKPNFPYSDNLTSKQIQSLLNRAMRNTDRWRTMKADGCSEEEIENSFRKPTEMEVFTYHGVVDTVMTPLDSIKHYKSFLRSGLCSIDPSNGHVKAYVGGVNHQYFQYDMCMQGRRQVGSTMKPFVYSLALMDGHTPDDEFLCEPQDFGGWTPRDGVKARGLVPMRWGLANSSNWVTADIMHEVDPRGERLTDLLHVFGILNFQVISNITLCLGTCEITVAEMADAYTAFANKGIRCAPILVSRIEDNEGNVLAEFQPRVNEVLSEQNAADMIDMLQGVVNHGTGGRLRWRFNLSGPIAGKTGTTNNNSDGWFVGFVPRLVTACWVGGEERDIHFNSTAYGQGAQMALPIWAYYMKSIYADTSLGYSEDEQFDLPERIREEESEEDITDDSNNVVDELFD